MRLMAAHSQVLMGSLLAPSRRSTALERCLIYLWLPWRHQLVYAGPPLGIPFDDQPEPLER
jgi:hypothetical protein